MREGLDTALVTTIETSKAGCLSHSAEKEGFGGMKTIREVVKWATSLLGKLDWNLSARPPTGRLLEAHPIHAGWVLGHLHEPITFSASYLRH